MNTAYTGCFMADAFSRICSIAILIGLSSCPLAVSAADAGSAVAMPAQSIAVVRFNASEAVGDVADIVSNDLVRTGEFAALPKGSLPQMPATPKEVDFAAWRALKLRYLVVGSLTKIGATWGARFYLMDVEKGEQLVGYDMPPVAPNQLRYVAHQIADLVYQRVTGSVGVANTKIAYVQAQGVGASRTYSLVIGDIDGAAPRIVATSRETLMSPAWSPDRKQLAFVGFERGQTAIYVLSLATGASRKVSARPGLNGSPAWSPDGKRLTFTATYDNRNPEVAILDLTSGNVTRVTQSPGVDTEGVWSPDGNGLAFTSDRTGQPRIYRAAADGSNPKPIATQARQNMAAALSPDGSWITCVCLQPPKFLICIQDTATGTERVLSAGGRDESPKFSPNSKQIAYYDGVADALTIMSLDGRVLSTLRPPNGSMREPTWSPVISVSPPVPR